MFQGTLKSMSDYLLTYNYFTYMKDSWTPENVAAGKQSPGLLFMITGGVQAMDLNLATILQLSPTIT